MTNTGEDMYEGYSMPTIAPTFPEGPIHYNIDAVVASYTMDEENYRKILPAPLEPLDEPQCQIWANDFYRTSGYGSYKELIAAPVAEYEGEPLAYLAFLYVSGGFPGLAAGREIWGAPKVYIEETSFVERGKEAQRVFSHGDVDPVTVTMVPERQANSIDELPIETDMELAGWKRIPSATEGKPPAVDRIVKLFLSDIEVNWGREGSAQVDITKAADSPLHLFEPVDEPDGYRIDFEWTLHTGDDAVLHTFEEHNP